jgi:NAD(P)-dependent dehydrogenase (short-subunit alcohol dehydrogenase family)
MNAALSPVLRSPLHALADGTFMLLEFTGRRTGKRYRFPVGYSREGDVVTIFTPWGWWKNLRGGAPVTVWLKGQRRSGTADVVTDPAAIAQAITPVLRRSPRIARAFGVRLDSGNQPNPDDVDLLSCRMTAVRVMLARAPQDQAARDESMRGKVVMVTGADRGMGKVTALALARKGATVVMVCRDRARGEAAKDEIISQSGNPAVELLLANLASQEASRQAAQEFLARHDRLDVLVNNAGAVISKRTVTPDGLEATFATNYLAPFLLTGLLLSALRAAAPSRVVNIASGAQAWGHLDFSNLQSARRYGAMRAYAQAKLAVITWTYELARRLSGTGVTANVLEPGFVNTNMPGDISPWIVLAKPIMRTPEEGARTAIFLASAPRAESYNGNYFNAKGAPTHSLPQSYDEAVARRLWDVSARLTGLDGEALLPSVRPATAGAPGRSASQ